MSKQSIGLGSKFKPIAQLDSCPGIISYKSPQTSIKKVSNIDMSPINFLPIIQTQPNSQYVDTIFSPGSPKRN